MFETLVEKTNKHQIEPHDTIRKVLKHRCLKCLRIVHLNLIYMSYDQKKSENQIGNLTSDHKSFESKGQMKSNWACYTPLERTF